MSTFKELKYKCMKHKSHVEEPRNILKTGRYFLDMWLVGSSDNSATVKLQIRPIKKHSVEVTPIKPVFVNHLIEIVKECGADMVKQAFLNSREKTLSECIEFKEENPSQEERVNELIKQYELEV